MKIVLVVGARPNFMKVAPILRAINKHNASTRSTHIEPLIVHTGQHYDYEMSQIFFKDLELPQPDIYLGVGSGTHAEQTGKIMIELEKVLFKEKPNLVVVVGDVNSTLAAALAAVKLCIPVAHVEAGLRSYDRTMPEEINRLLTDAISDYLFTPSHDADENLTEVEQMIHQERYTDAKSILDQIPIMIEDIYTAMENIQRLPGAAWFGSEFMIIILIIMVVVSAGIFVYIIFVYKRMPGH